MIRAAVHDALVGMNGSAPTLAGEQCAGCDGPMVITHDAIGRPRKRCPKCDGISHNRRHPDEVLLPQGLVRAHARLPEIAAGQLRCQRCARGVEGRARFCSDCHGKTKRKLCRCGATFVPTRRRQFRCDGCFNAAKNRAAVTLCTGCNRTWKRKHRGHVTVASCEDCRGFTRNGPAVRTCLGCGATSPRKPRTRVKVKTCRQCPRPPKRVAKPKPPGLPHPRTLPADHPRRLAWIAARAATMATLGPPVFKPRICQSDGCGAEFVPSGAAAKYCPSCASAPRAAGAPRRFAAKACLRCGKSFQPTGARSVRCEACR